MPEVHYIKFAGRNRMLSRRRIGRFFVYRFWGLGEEDMGRGLEAARGEFEAKLQ